MKTEPMVLLALSIFLLTSTAFNPIVYAVEERKVLSRNYVGLGLNVYAPYQCYPGETIAVRVRVEALEDVKNASVTVFIWGSKSEGNNPWSTSFAVLDVTDFPSGTVKEEAYNVTMPSDIDPGLTYGILFLDWSIYRAPSWEYQWDKASFRATYMKNRDFENIQEMYTQLEMELNNSRTLAYFLSATSIAFAISAVYFAKKRKKTYKLP